MNLITQNVGRVLSVLPKLGVLHPVKGVMNVLKPVTLLPAPALPCQSIQVRGRYLCWKMLRDVKRRRLVKQHYIERLRINALRRNTILPREIFEMADAQIRAFPIDSNRSRIHDRCMLTSRPKGLVKPHNVSRIMFRILADYNKLSGVIRAKW